MTGVGPRPQQVTRRTTLTPHPSETQQPLPPNLAVRAYLKSGNSDHQSSARVTGASEQKRNHQSAWITPACPAAARYTPLAATERVEAPATAHTYAKAMSRDRALMPH